MLCFYPFHNCLAHRIIAKNKSCLSSIFFANPGHLMYWESLYQNIFLIFKLFLGVLALLKYRLYLKNVENQRCLLPLNFKCLPFSHFWSYFHNFWNVSCEYIELQSKYIKFRFLGVHSLIFLSKISSLNEFLDHFQTSIPQKSLRVRTWNFLVC